jgi:membrane protein
MTWKEFLKALKEEVTKDGIPDLAATVTYYGLLALFPFLLFLVGLASLVIQPADAERLVEQLSEVAPGAVTDIVGGWIQELGQRQDTSILGLGALGAIWAASGGTMALIRALNVTYDVREGRPFWKVRLIAIAMTLVASVLALVAALAAIATPPLAARLGEPFGMILIWARLPIAGLLMMFLWALLYYVLPDVEQDFKFITPGSVMGVVLWVLASWGFSQYVANFGSYEKTYGALGGVVILLLWMWISALVLLVGAEVNAVIEHKSEEGKRQGAKRLADSGTAPKAVIPGRGEPVPAGPDGRPAVPARRGSLRGVVGIAAGFVAGLLVARRPA